MSHPFLTNKLAFKNKRQNYSSRSLLKSLPNFTSSNTSRQISPRRSFCKSKMKVSDLVLPIQSQNQTDFQQSSELLEISKSNRIKVEKIISDCEEFQSFRATFQKSGDLLNFFVKEIWFSCKQSLPFLQKYTQMENHLTKHLKKLSHKFSYLKINALESKKLKLEKEKLETENAALKRQNESFKALLKKQKPCHECEKSAKLQRTWTKEKSHFENTIASLNNQLQESRNKELAQQSNSSIISQISYNLMIKEFKKKKMELNSIITRLQYELGETKDLVKEKEQQISDLEHHLNKTIYETHTHEKREIVSMFSERLRMQHEDLLSVIPYKDLSTKQAETIKHLEDSLAVYEEKEKTTQKTTHTPPINFSDPVFSIFYNYNKSRLKQTKKKVETIKFTEFTFNKPSFACFVKLPSNRKIVYKPMFDGWLEVTIRAILDSKFAEHTLCSFDSMKIPCPLPEFVNDWIGHFYVDSNSRSVEEIEWWKKNQIHENKIMLLGGLSESISKTVWEIYTFKELLGEESAIDELGFYLHSRHLLFDGPQLSSEAGKKNKIHTVHIDKVFEILDRLLVDVELEVLGEIKLMLQTRCENSLIDSAIVLRVMLECYRSEKQHKVKSLKTAFDNAIKTEYYVTFESFCKIWKTLDKDLTDGQLARAFRQTWGHGNGIITYESAMTIANENGLFYWQLKLNGMESKQPTQRNDIAKDWQNSCNELWILKRMVVSLGIPAVADMLKRFEDLIQNWNQSEEPSGIWDLVDVYKHYWNFYNKLFMLLHETSMFVQTDVDINLFRLPFNAFIQFAKEKMLESLKMTIAARRIQTWYRYRILFDKKST